MVVPHRPESPRTPGMRSSADQGRVAYAMEPTSFAHATPAELQQLLLSIFQSPKYRPPVLPRVAVELTDLTRRPSASYDEVVSVLQKDPLIVANVMRVAQSPLYGARSPLQSLKDAVQRLGINALRDIVWQVVAGLRLFRVKGFTSTMERLQLHSMFVAYAARLVATRAGIAAEHAFLCGLLHDVGISGTLIALAETEKDLVPFSGLFDAINGMHEQAGATMAKLWKLSPEIIAVLDQHHRFDPNRPGVPVLTALICVAEHLADDFGYGVLDGISDLNEKLDRHAPGRYDLALKRLRLEGKDDELRIRAEEIAERLNTVM